MRNSNYQKIGEIIWSCNPQYTVTEPGNTYEICTLTLPNDGIWFLIGYTLTVGNLIFSQGALSIGRVRQHDEFSNYCFGLVRGIDAVNPIKLFIEVPSDYISSTIHADMHYCGAKAIRIA